MHAGFHRRLHQLMVGGMEFDEIDPVPKTIVTVEFRFILIRQETSLYKLMADVLSVSHQIILRIVSLKAGSPMLKGEIGFVGIIILERSRLIEDFMGFRLLTRAFQCFLAIVQQI